MEREWGGKKKKKQKKQSVRAGARREGKKNYSLLPINERCSATSWEAGPEGPSHGCARVRQHPGVSPSDVTMGAHPAQARVTVAPIVTSLGDTPGLRLIRAQPWLGPSVSVHGSDGQGRSTGPSRSPRA